jgi:hypothetical protein
VSRFSEAPAPPEVPSSARAALGRLHRLTRVVEDELRRDQDVSPRACKFWARAMKLVQVGAAGLRAQWPPRTGEWTAGFGATLQFVGVEIESARAALRLPAKADRAGHSDAPTAISGRVSTALRHLLYARHCLQLFGRPVPDLTTRTKGNQPDPVGSVGASAPGFDALAEATVQLNCAIEDGSPRALLDATRDVLFAMLFMSAADPKAVSAEAHAGLGRRLGAALDRVKPGESRRELERVTSLIGQFTPAAVARDAWMPANGSSTNVRRPDRRT